MVAKRQSLLRYALRIAGAGLGLVAAAGLAIVGLLFWQGRQPPATDGSYVALGSSFAAGIGLGPRARGSPIQCFRTDGGYPPLVARRAGLALVDMTCSGSTTGHILDGGQMLLGPQLAAIGPDVRHVTITSGGNDVGYIGDLMAASGNMGRVGRWLNGAVKPAADRPYAAVERNLNAIIAHVRARAPKARIFLVSYPAIFPANGNCAATGVSDQQAGISRSVAARLAAVTRKAAAASGATLVDMHGLSAGHDVCSGSPWVSGAVAEDGAPFHPNKAGSAAIAASIIAAMTLLERKE
jgi:lysophospholipase L1-like esterase